MTAARIIEEIKHLPEAEKAQVIEFVRDLARERRLDGKELQKLAEKLAETQDPAEAQALKEQITRGFYGSEDNA